MNKVSFMVLIFFCLNVSGQQRNIFLTTFEAGDNHNSYKDYIFTNKGDTAFLSIEYGGDMGRIFSAYPKLKNTLPDGEYRIYVDSVLLQKATFVNHLRNGMNYTYYPNGEYLETPYSLGQIEGKVTKYKNGNLFSEAFFVKNKCMLRIVYDETGHVNNNELYINTALVRNEVINENNKIKKIVDYKMLTKSEDPGLINTELNGQRTYKYKEGTFFIAYKRNRIIDWNWVENNTENPPVFYHSMIKLEGNTGQTLLLFKNLISSDSAFFQFGDVLDKKPLTFYLDTLSKELFYNNYVVDHDNINIKQKNNFDKIYNVGAISLESGVLRLIKKPVSGKNFNEFFYNKITLSDLNENLLVKLSDFSAQSQSKTDSITNFYRQDFLLDLNSDGLKEKVGISIKFNLNDQNDSETSQELTMSFFRKKGANWFLYDKLMLSKDLEKNIDQIIIFKQKKNANIYVNSSSTTLSGRDVQSQILIVGNQKNKPAKIVR